MQKIIYKGFPFRQRQMLRSCIRKELSDMEVLPDAPIEIEAAQKITHKQYGSLWYGGTMVNIKYKGWRFEICATGEVRADLLHKVDPSCSILYVKDKSCNGRLGEELQPYISTDKAMNAALCNKHTKYQLILDNGNWYECLVFDSQGELHDLMWSLDSDHILAGIAEVIFWMDKTIRDIRAIDTPALAAG